MNADTEIENLGEDGLATLSRIEARARLNRRAYAVEKAARARLQPSPGEADVLVKPERHRRNKRKPVKFYNPANRD